jgi:hypothetical protein
VCVRYDILTLGIYATTWRITEERDLPRSRGISECRQSRSTIWCGENAPTKAAASNPNRHPLDPHLRFLLKYQTTTRFRIDVVTTTTTTSVLHIVDTNVDRHAEKRSNSNFTTEIEWELALGVGEVLVSTGIQQLTNHSNVVLPRSLVQSSISSLSCGSHMSRYVSNNRSASKRATERQRERITQDLVLSIDIRFACNEDSNCIGVATTRSPVKRSVVH